MTSGYDDRRPDGDDDSRGGARSIAVARIGELTTADGPVRHAAAVVIEGDHISWVGADRDVPAADQRIDVDGAAVIPGFVDSHSHLVFAGDRSEEFAARMSGKPYCAGGIQTTVTATRAATDDALRVNLHRLVTEAARQGTTALECKSGYGLTVADEARSLRIAREVTADTTFLGAHVVAPEYADDPTGYIDLVTGQMLDACAPYARFVDVFCDRGAFDAGQTRRVLDAGIDHGLVPRLHANQLRTGPGVQLAVEYGAASADHCSHLTDADVAALAGSRTVATLLPAAEFSTRADYPDARALIDGGATVALATDCNPGSAYTTSMPFVIALAVREMGMTPAEALWSATAGGAAALRRTDIGRIAVGARADLVILDAPSHVHLAYRPGVPLVRTVIRTGQII